VIGRASRGFALLLMLLPLGVAADDQTASDDALSDDAILGAPADSSMVVRSARLRLSFSDQAGHGYQSQAERASVATPGSEQLYVEQPQLEVEATQGKLTHRLWVPVDVVTAASADAIDATSSASRKNESVSFDLNTTYHATPSTEGSLRAATHIEEPFRSYQMGVGIAHSFAQDNALIAASVNQSIDEFDRFTIIGTRRGRAYRSSSNGNLALTQLLSPTTIGYVGYGGTLQVGELSNTWNAVRVGEHKLGREYLPRARGRHAFLARLAQALPFDAALHASYRFYADSWRVRAHTLETELFQRLGRVLVLRGVYRLHTQNAPWFWTSEIADGPVRSADSDLASFHAQTIGGGVAIDVARVGGLHSLHADLGYERYFRSNDLRVNVYTCGVGFGF
jgi:hypothetical protein